MSKSDQPAGVAVDRRVRPLVDRRGDLCTLALYEVLADLANEAGAVDTVIGRPRALYERLCSLRDAVGAAKSSATPSTLPAEWLVKARLAAHQPSHTTTATPQGVASTDQLGGRVRSEKE